MTLSSSLKISSSSMLHDLIESQTQEAVIDLRSKIDEIMDSLGRDLFSEI
jgi:NifU-like protein involved in Fe-S cluster formation